MVNAEPPPPGTAIALTEPGWKSCGEAPLGMRLVWGRRSRVHGSGIQTPLAQGRSTKFVSMIKFIVPEGCQLRTLTLGLWVWGLGLEFRVEGLGVGGQGSGFGILGQGWRDGFWFLV